MTVPTRAASKDAVALVSGRRRTTELGLLILAFIVIVGLYALASLGRNASVPANIGPFLAAVLALVLVAHLVVRKVAPAADALLLPLAALLNGMGYVFIARLNDDLAGLQAAWTAAGITCFVLTLVLVKDIKVLQRYRYTFGLIGVLLLLMPLLPVLGNEINGSRIWVSLGPIGFQPGEFAKIALAIFFAGYLQENRELLSVATFRLGPFSIPDPKHFAPILLAWGVALAVMIFQRDLGSALLFFVLFVVMLWVATGRAAYLVAGVILFATGAALAYSQFSHVQQRVEVWLDPWTDPQGVGYQIVQSVYALSWGGVVGTGPGLGISGRIPFEETDFIFAIIAEELGLLGSTAVLCTFLLMVGSGLRIARRCSDGFGSLLAVGLTTLIGVQAFIIVGGVIRLMPLTGITLPFVSYGGSSLVANYVLLALLLRISDGASRRVPQPVLAR